MLFFIGSLQPLIMEGRCRIRGRKRKGKQQICFLFFFLPSVLISRLKVAEDAHEGGFFFYAAECVADGGVFEVSFDVYKETVFPVSSRDRAGFDLGHVEVVVEKV